MRRAILVALGAAAVISSAAALGIGAAVISAPHTIGQEATATEMVRVADIEESYRRTRQSSRAAQRARIEARYQVERAKCGALGGFKRDRCLVSVHAAKGRSMLKAAAPYEVRF